MKRLLFRLGKDVLNVVLLLLFTIVCSSSMPASKNWFSVNNLYYTIVPNTDNVSVRRSENKEYGNLEKIVIPSKVSYLGKTYNVIGIGYGAFQNCEQLKEVQLPNTILEIANSAFAVCKNLKSIVIPEKTKSIGDRAFSSCYSLNKVVLPKRMEDLGSYAFAECTKLEEITIPEGIKGLTSTFYGCTSLKRVLLPNSLTVLREAFSHCESLTSINIPENVKIIARSTFFRCNNLKSITLGSGLKEILPRAFYKCESLERIIIPINTETVHAWAFMDCPNLKQVIVSSNSNISDNIFNNCPNAKIVRNGSSVNSQNFNNNQKNNVIRNNKVNTNSRIKNTSPNQRIINEQKLTFNESKGKDIGIVELVEKPFGLKKLDNKLLKKDFDVLMKSSYPEVKVDKDNEYYTYGWKSSIDISCEGKLMYLSSIRFANLNSLKKNGIQYVWYKFAFDEPKYSLDDMKQFVNLLIKKLQAHYKHKGDIPKKDQFKSIELHGDNKNVVISLDSSSRHVNVAVYYEPFRF